MNLFENPKYYNKNDFFALSEEEQNELFLHIRSWLPKVPNEVRYRKDKYKQEIINRIEQVCAYACAGHIPSQDYMGYIYKRGFDDFFPVNYKRALEWNIIAAAGGSKLAPQKMRAFLNPAVDSILFSTKWNQIRIFNNLTYENYYWFLGGYVCDVLYNDLKLNCHDMAKKELIEEDTNERKIRIFFDRYRDKSVEKAIEELTKELPDDLPEDPDDEGKFGEELLRHEDGRGRGEFESIYIEDIDDDDE